MGGFPLVPVRLAFGVCAGKDICPVFSDLGTQPRKDYIKLLLVERVLEDTCGEGCLMPRRASPGFLIRYPLLFPFLVGLLLPGPLSASAGGTSTL